MTIYIVLAVIFCGIAVGLLWDWWHSGWLGRRPIPRPYRNRASQEALWRERYQGNQLLKAEHILALVCDAFMFNTDYRYLFAPEDRLLDVYRACYPRWKIADSMELESLMMDLDKEDTIELPDNPDITLGDLVNLAIKKQQSGTNAPR
jgi:hypothetical protein